MWFHASLAAGESWAHACTNRLLLLWSDEQRFAHLFKSPYLPAGMAAFCVDGRGVRDAVTDGGRGEEWGVVGRCEGKRRRTQSGGMGVTGLAMPEAGR